MLAMKDYLQLIDTNTSGPRCDVTPLFAQPEAFAKLVADLCSPFEATAIDYVAGIDALGFVLGTAMAVHLHKGFIPIRKGGKLPAAVSMAEFVDYSGQRKTLELRKGSIKPGEKVLVVDEWIETGAQVQAAVDLIEGAGGSVVGIAAINMDDNPIVMRLRQKYKCHTAWIDMQAGDGELEIATAGKNSMKNNLALRDVIDSDLPVFFAHQLDPEANYMAAFVAKDPANREAFNAHWKRIRGEPSILIRTVLCEGDVAGSVLSYEEDGRPEVSYWLGREYWGWGIATWALDEFLRVVNRKRPIYARVAKDNLASRRVLEKCGFLIIAEERGFANARGKEIEELLLERRL
jgi:adenine phosphoribosyltransferase